MKTKQEKTHVLYSTDGKHWWRREWVKQCDNEVFFGGECQGVDGHKGVHWCYAHDGSFIWENQDEQVIKDTNIAGGTTPPGHKKWISPKKMIKHHYMNNFTDTEITDKQIIARLEKSDPPEKWASITRPITPDELKIEASAR